MKTHIFTFKDKNCCEERIKIKARETKNKQPFNFEVTTLGKEVSSAQIKQMGMRESDQGVES